MPPKDKKKEEQEKAARSASRPGREPLKYDPTVFYGEPADAYASPRPSFRTDVTGF